MKKILVVDDNPDILNSIKLVLEMEQYEVLLCSDGSKAVAVCSESEPDLVILDIMLGEFDGRDICSFLKRLESTSHIPIIMISGSHSILQLAENDCHAEDYLAKPFEVSGLLEKVAMYV